LRRNGRLVGNDEILSASLGAFGTIKVWPVIVCARENPAYHAPSLELGDGSVVGYPDILAGSWPSGSYNWSSPSDGISTSDAVKYVKDKFDLTQADVRAMRKAVSQWRGVYEERYRDIRHGVFAHKSLNRTDTDALMAQDQHR
jgi:hypothetical protein